MSDYCENCELYQADLNAILKTMEEEGYPYHPEYPEKNAIILRLKEMAYQKREAEEQAEHAGQN